MKAKTKIVRANLAVELLQNNEGVPKTLGNWLQFFNTKFSSTYRFRSTKELAHMFRYIKIHMDCVKLEKKKQVVAFESCRTKSTTYTFKMEKKIKTPEIICEDCSKEMSIVDQKHGKTKIVRIKYECECGAKGVVLLQEDDGSFDRYVYSPQGEMVKYDNG